MSTNGLTRSAGRSSLGKYVETWNPSPTQWNPVLRWTPSTLRTVDMEPSVSAEAPRSSADRGAPGSPWSMHDLDDAFAAQRCVRLLMPHRIDDAGRGDEGQV